MIKTFKEAWLSFYFTENKPNIKSLFKGLVLTYICCVCMMLIAIEIHYIMNMILHLEGLIVHFIYAIIVILFVAGFLGMFINIIMFSYLRNINGLHIISFGD